jgi:hypothetical protein
MVSGDRYLYNKSMWNYIPPPPGPRAYYSDGFARDEIIPDPKDGDLYIQGATNQLCIFQNGQWRSKVFVSPEIRESINMYNKPNRREVIQHRIDQDIEDSDEDFSFSSSDDEIENQPENKRHKTEEQTEEEQTEEEQTEEEQQEEQREDKFKREDEDEVKTDIKEGNLRVSLPLRHKLGDMGMNDVPHLGSASKHFKLNFEKSQAWLEGTYVNLSVETFEKIFPHISENVANLQVLPQGMVDVNLKFGRPHSTPIEFRLETWIKYSDANGNLWQTVTCLADFQVLDEHGQIFDENEYELIPESGQKLVDLQQFHKTLTTLAPRETIILKSERGVGQVKWKSKLLAYPVKAERKEFYAVQFNDLQKSITLPKLGVKID